MKRKTIVMLLTLILFLLPAMTGVESSGQVYATVNVTKLPSMRVVVDGSIKNYSGMLYGGTVYYTASAYKDILSRMKAKTPKKAAKLTYNKATYYSLEDACKQLNMSFEYDSLMKDVYIWTFESYAEDTMAEINEAIQLGLVPKILQGDYDKQITFKENGTLIQALINLADKNKLKTLKNQIPKTFTSKDRMARGHGMAVLAYTAVVLGWNQYNYNWGDINIEIGTKCWDELDQLNWTLFPHISSDSNPIYNEDGTRENWSMYAGMYFYSFGRASLISNKTLFDYDAAEKSMHPDQALTRKAAIKAVLRLYESVNHTKEILTLQEASVGNTAILTNELLKKAALMPEPTLEQLPYYAGLTYNNCAFPEWYESDIRKIAEWGFNYIRVRVEYETLFDENVTTAKGKYFDMLDRLISWGMKYGVHIDLQLTEYPGWRVLKVSEDTTSSAELDYYTNREQQLKTLTLWKVLTSRYKDVPNNALTFTVDHEPFNRTLTTDSPPSKHTYQDIVNAVSEICDTIHQIDSDRVLFTESGFTWELGYLPYAADLPVVNTFKESSSNDFVYWNLITDYTNSSGYLPNWPITKYVTNSYIMGERGSGDMKNMPLVLNGTLPKDTKITIQVRQIDGSGDCTVEADGVRIASEALNPQVGAEGCIDQNPGSQTYDYQTTKSFVGDNTTNYQISGKTISFTLPSDTKALTISYTGEASGWIAWSGIQVEMPAAYSIERWYYTSASDNYQAGKGAVDECAPRKISQIFISPGGGWGEASLPITIHSDLTYSTTQISYQVNRDTLRAGTEKWVNTARENGMKTILCNEFVTFRGNTSKNLCAYLNDLLSVYNELNIGWVYFGAYNGTIYDSDTVFALQGPCNEFDVNTLKTLQKYQKVEER